MMVVGIKGAKMRHFSNQSIVEGTARV
jgi:hypothetical protein